MHNFDLVPDWEMAGTMADFPFRATAAQAAFPASPMSEHKFECGKCGQRLSVTDDVIGMAANCPTRKMLML